MSIHNELNFKLENHMTDIIFFDIFDTIITRMVHPEYVKKIFSKILKEHYRLQLSSDDLYQMRFNIEAKLCQKNQKKGFDLEFRFVDFTAELFERLQGKNLLDGRISFDSFLKECRNFEIEAELMTQEINNEMVDLIKLASQNDISVYALSDFYLSKEMLQTLFAKHGILDYFSDIFVSSEYLLTKRSGRLYEKLKNDYFTGKKAVMIGDNEHSDFNMAREYGIEAYLIDRTKQRAFYQAHEANVLTPGQLHKKIEKIIGVEYSAEIPVYFKEMAFTLYYFIYRLYLEVVSNGKKDLFFLSREGEFLKKLFDLFLKINNIDDIRSHYLIVSRKSTFIASLKKLDEENFETLFRQYRNMSVETFLKSLNFTTDEINSISSGKIWKLQKREQDLPTSTTFEQLLEDRDFQVLYEKKRMQQKENLKSYIQSFGVDVKRDGLALVDAGWKGTIQDHVFKTLDKKVVVKGYYIGLVTDAMPEKSNIKKGLVFDYKHPDRYDKVFEENMAIFEVLLGASHGSADRYEKDKNGDIEPVTYQEREEAVIFEQIVSPIQNVLYDIFQKIADEFILSHVSILDMRKEVAKIHARMIYEPTKEEIGFFRQLYHFENFGLFEFSTFDKYRTNNKKEQLINIMKFVKNPRKFLSSTFWKAAAMDDIGLLNLYLLYGIYQKGKIFGSLR